MSGKALAAGNLQCLRAGYPRPTCGSQDDDGDATLRQILLVFQVLIRGHQNLKTRFLRLLQQLAVFESVLA